MNRLLIALATATVVGAAVPATAGALQMDLPNLNFPTQPEPDTTQGCADLTTLSGDTCATPAK